MTEIIGQPEIADQEMASILSSPYFFECPDPENDECLECDESAFGTLYLWHEAEDDIGCMGYLCKYHFSKNYLENWKGSGYI
jgi:hypothetical protein